MDYKASPVTNYSVQPMEKGEIASTVVWNLEELKTMKIPFEHLNEDELECIMELSGGAIQDSKVQIRFGLQKTQYPNLAGDDILNYLSLTATALNTGGRDGIKFLVSLDYLRKNLTVKSRFFKNVVVHLKSRLDRGSRVIFKQLLFYSCYNDAYYREISEKFNTDAMIFGITVTLLHQTNHQPLQKVSSQDDLSFTKSLEAMYESEQSYSDIKLETKDDMVLDAHKFILAARSSVFRNMLNKAKDEEGAEEGKLRIDNINGKPLRSILHWMYTNSLDESADNIIGEVMEGAKVLQLREFLALIDSKLITICHPKNMMQLFTAALEHKMRTAVEDIREYIKEHIEDPSLKL